MNISDLSSSGALPALASTLRFAGQRQQILAHNIANIDTPNFIATDVDPRSFQKLLGDAIDERRDRNGGSFGALSIASSGGIDTGPDGHGLTLNPTAPHGGVLGHDRNASDIERLMQDMVENAGMYRVASDLLRKHQSTILTAIAQRV